jgi:hypothetical protein
LILVIPEGFVIDALIPLQQWEEDSSNDDRPVLAEEEVTPTEGRRPEPTVSPSPRPLSAQALDQHALAKDASYERGRASSLAYWEPLNVVSYFLCLITFGALGPLAM